MTLAATQRATPFDDFEARPGSATSLVRTIVGLYLRELDSRVTSAELVRLLGAAGVAEAHARTAITRVKNKGLLL
ncbi:MAG TPA: regulator, partial [Terrimesophilobacter sp.]|nr:regulator [Terrimesophilobacter sp.]